MKVPISKELTEHLMLTSLIVAAVGFYDLFFAGQKLFHQNIVFIAFIVPTLLFAWLLFDSRVEFKDNTKVRKADRWFRLPFSSSAVFLFSLFRQFLCVLGLP